jgi:hypothetical protein
MQTQFVSPTYILSHLHEEGCVARRMLSEFKFLCDLLLIWPFIVDFYTVENSTSYFFFQYLSIRPSIPENVDQILTITINSSEDFGVMYFNVDVLCEKRNLIARRISEMNNPHSKHYH